MSVKILKNTLNDQQINIIRSLLVITPSVNNFNNYNTDCKSIIFYYTDKDYIYLPFNFASILFNYISNSNISYPSTNFTFKGDLRQYQLSIVNEAMEQLQSKRTTLLALFPGAGKTVISAYLSSKLNVLTLVLCHRVMLTTQWLESYSTYTSANVIEVGDNANYQNYDVIICMDKQFSKIPNDIINNIGCLIIDEAHLFCTPSRVSCLLGTHPKYIIACTATPNREDGLFQMIQSIIGLHGVFRPLNKDFLLYRIFTGISPPIKKNIRGDLEWSSLIKELCLSEKRNSIIFDLVKYLNNEKILILTWSKFHAVYLHKILSEKSESVAILAGKLNTYSDSRILCGTLSKIGVGFDEKTSCYNFNGIRLSTLILCGTTKCSELIEQLFGRIFRSDNCKIYCLIDDVPVCKRHWYIINKWGLQHGATVDTIDLRKSPSIFNPLPTSTL